MSKLNYKVLRNGRITAFLGEREVSGLLLNEPVPFEQRAALRQRLDRDLFRAMLAMFGANWVPADYNEMCDSKKLIKQLAADKLTKLVALVYPFIQQGYLKATPSTTALKRLKSVLMRENFTPIRRNAAGWFVNDGKRAQTDVNQYWSHYDDKPALTEAGWRFLCRQSCTVLRKLTERPWQLRDEVGLFNAFPVAGVTTVTAVDLNGVDRLSRSLREDRDSFQHVLLAWKNAPYRGVSSFFESTAFYRQADVISDWLSEAKPVVTAGATWQSLLTRSLDWAATKAEIESSEMENLKWDAAIEPFVANDGLVVTAITSGPQLLEEGREMKNCLPYHRHYAEDCVKGLSQIFRIQGVQGRATVQFERRLGQAWKLSQAEERDNVPVSSPVIKRAIEQLKQRMEVPV